MVQATRQNLALAPRWVSRSAALPYLSNIAISPAKPGTYSASLMLNDQIHLREIELDDTHVLFPWVLVDDAHHTANVLAFRSAQNIQHLENCLHNPQQALAQNQGKSFVARWNLVITEIRVTPVESFWHDTVAMVTVCLNQELELNGIRIRENGSIVWPTAIDFLDLSLQDQIEAAIQKQRQASNRV